MPLATEGTQEHIIIYCHAKTLGERHAARGRQPRRAGRAGANVSEREAGVRPRSRSFCCEKLYFGARPGGCALRGYLVMARMKVAMDMSIEVMVKKMLVEELKKALRA